MNNNRSPQNFSTVFSTDTFERMSLQPDQARGLPNEAFISEEFFKLEQQKLFPRSWIFAGRASMVPEPGNRAPVEIAGLPLVIVRDDKGEVRVFHNVCPHRGSRIVPCSDQGSQTITCPYHSWTFNLDGSLAVRPHFHGPDQHDTPPIDSSAKSKLPHLFEVRFAQWFDWIFVNLDGQAAPFDEFSRPAREVLDDYPLNEFTFEAMESFEFDCNWKLVAENWIDMYHIFRIHPGLNAIMEPETRGGMSIDEAFIFRQYSMTRRSRALGLVPAKGVDKVDGLVTFALLFPGVGITVDTTNVLFANFTALAANHTRMDMYFYFTEEVTNSAKYKQARQAYRNWWIELNGEDEDICRLLQLGRQSPAYDGGRFAPYWDGATLHFQRSIVERMRD